MVMPGSADLSPAHDAVRTLAQLLDADHILEEQAAATQKQLLDMHALRHLAAALQPAFEPGEELEHTIGEALKASCGSTQAYDIAHCIQFGPCVHVEACIYR